MQKIWIRKKGSTAASANTGYSDTLCPFRKGEVECSGGCVFVCGSFTDRNTYRRIKQCNGYYKNDITEKCSIMFPHTLSLTFYLCLLHIALIRGAIIWLSLSACLSSFVVPRHNPYCLSMYVYIWIKYDQAALHNKNGPAEIYPAEPSFYLL